MGLPTKPEIASYIEDTHDMAKAVSEEDVQMFVVNNNRASKGKGTVPIGRFYHPKQTIAEYFKDNKTQDFNSKKVEKFLERGVLDNVLFNFLFSRGMSLKDGLIDINRAFTMVKKINESELDFPEKVPDQPLNEDEKLEIV